MSRWQNRWALVTGSSAGIGWALAEELAARGAKLVLAARRRDRLDALAQKLTAAHNSVVRVVPVDLGRPDGPGRLFRWTVEQGIAVDLLVNNAGFGLYGEFHSGPLDRSLEMVQVNVSAVVELTHRFLAGMVERRAGDILIVSSVAAFQPVPYLSCYAATKAFDLLFAEGLAEEVRRYGIRVCALCPGTTTATEFARVAGESGRPLRHTEPAAKVARVGLNALAAGKTYVISGWLNYLQTHAERLAPRPFVARSAAAMMAPREGK